MDNQIYGLTTGQTSPTSRLGMKTKSMPFGSIESPLNPISLALAAGATFVARGFSADQKHLTELIKQGIEHKGFSFIDVFSPCVTLQPRQHLPVVPPAGEEARGQPRVRFQRLGRSHGEIAAVGRRDPHREFFERTDLPSLHDAEPVLKSGPLVKQDIRLPADIAKSFNR